MTERPAHRRRLVAYAAMTVLVLVVLRIPAVQSAVAGSLVAGLVAAAALAEAGVLTGWRTSIVFSGCKDFPIQSTQRRQEICRRWRVGWQDGHCGAVISLAFS